MKEAGGPDPRSAAAPTVWSLGHSTLALESFLELLATHEIERLVDVRRYPRSRRHPHFTREPLALALARADVHYVHLPDLGGHREARPESLHTAVPAGPFRGYADHMESPAFAAALAQLVALARERRTAVMCAEARWTDCHRRLLCDALFVKGVRVLHVQRVAPTTEHALHPAARIDGERIAYVRGAERGLFG